MVIRSNGRIFSRRPANWGVVFQERVVSRVWPTKTTAHKQPPVVESSIMTVALSPNKPGPDARLARKREAARMRQQRCRARKRQTMLSKRRHPEGRAAQLPSVVPDVNTVCTKPSPFREAQLTSSPSRDPIFKIVSFDSPRLPQRDVTLHATMQQTALPVISRSCSAESSLCPSSPTKRSVEIVRIKPSEPEESLVEEEEAAIAAMLSLKSAASPNATPPASPQDSTVDSRPTPVKTATDPQYIYYGEWDRYNPPYGYGRYAHYPPVPYYAMPPRVSASTPYHCLPYGKGYSRYRYE